MTAKPASSAQVAMPDPIRPKADHADGLDLSRLDVFEARNLGRRPFGEEDMPQRRGLFRIRADARNVRALLRQSVRERTLAGQPHQPHGFARRILTTGAGERLAGRRVDRLRRRRR